MWRTSAIAKKYAAHPVLKKRALFQEVADQLFEASPNAKMDVSDITTKEGESRDRVMAALAATEPSIDLTVTAVAAPDSKLNVQVELNYNAIATATVNFYTMDLELLFSTNPFFGGGSSAGGSAKDANKLLFVSPNHSVTLQLPKDKVGDAHATMQRKEAVLTTRSLFAVFSLQSSIVFPLPAQFHNANVFVEAVGPGGNLTRVQPFYSNSMTAALIENYGST